MHFFSSAQFNNKTTWAACKRTQHCLSTTPNINWWMLYVASVCTPCWMLQRVVAQSLQRVKLFSQQLLTFLLFPDRQTIAQQCWIRLHSSSNIVGVTHTHYAWFTKTYGLYLSHDALQVPTWLELLHPFAHHCQHVRNNSQHCWRNNGGSCCVHLHTALSLFSSISGLETFFQFQTFPTSDLLTILLVALSS